MFDLEQSITEWRRQMLAAGIKSPVPLEELESHLRDDLEQQMRSGVSAPAAFDAAVARLGRADVLKPEFKRGRFDIRALSPVYMRMFCLLGVPLLLGMIWAFTDGEMSPGYRYFGIGSVSLIALYVGGLPVFYHRLFAQYYRLMSRVILAGNVVAVACPLLSLLAEGGVIALDKLASLLLWSTLAAHVANCLACANFDREAAANRAVKLAGS
jgi:hypothetical protein